MTLRRRKFLAFLAAGLGGASVLDAPSLVRGAAHASRAFNLTGGTSPQIAPRANRAAAAFNFTPLRGSLPLETDGLTAAEQISFYAQHEIRDELLLPPDFTYNVVAAWGDRVGDSRFGYNNDYLSYVETNRNAGYLTVNFEYISPVAWMQTYAQVIGRELPFAEVREQVRQMSGRESVNAYALPDSSELKRKIRDICREALTDQGLGVIRVRQTRGGGDWTRDSSREDRRITGLSGLTDARRLLRSTGPASAVFRKATGEGYIDRFGDAIVGSFGNCAGGTTPWGTVLSGEENFQSQVPERVFRDGTSADPSELLFSIAERNLTGQGNVFGLAGNKYGWIVEVDPTDANDYGTKHTWLGRFRHEAVGVRVERGRRLAFYSGCDRTGGHVYKFVSRDAVRDPRDKRNSRLLEHGMLYVAKFNANGTGRWIPLTAQTPVDPDSPSVIAGGMFHLPRRDEGGEPRIAPQTERGAAGGESQIRGYVRATTDAEIENFKRRFRTLGDLYTGNAEERQGAILIDAHYAANAAGATCTARPEDTEIAPDGSLYIAFTSGTASADGGSDTRIFRGPRDETGYEFGFIMRLIEVGGDPAATSFTWRMIGMGGEPSDGGAGFVNPDNLLVDRAGNLWIVTDMYSQNRALPSRTDETGRPLAPSSATGLFGNNSILFMPTAGSEAGKAFLFGTGPMECELTGPFLTPDERTLFLAIQHPGELNGVRRAGAKETRRFAMKTTDGREFMQTREVPVGSNWPGGGTSDPPRPAVVAVRRRVARANATRRRE